LRILLTQCGKIDKGFERFKVQANTLDAFYIPARYPVSQATFSKHEAEKAICVAEEIITFIDSKVCGGKDAEVAHDGEVAD